MKRKIGFISTFLVIFKTTDQMCTTASCWKWVRNECVLPGVHNTAKSEARNTCNYCRVNWPWVSPSCAEKSQVFLSLFCFFKASVKGLYYGINSLLDCPQGTLTRQRMWYSRTAWQGWKENVFPLSDLAVRRGLFTCSASLPLGLIPHKKTNVWVKDFCNEG